MNLFHRRATDPGSRLVAPESLEIADRLARQARADRKPWLEGHTPPSPRMSWGWLSKHLAVAGAVGAAWLHWPGHHILIAAVAVVATWRLLPKLKKEYRAARETAKNADPKRHAETLLLARKLGIAPSKLTYSVLQTLALQHRDRLQNAPAREAATEAQQHLDQEALVRRQIAGIQDLPRGRSGRGGVRIVPSATGVGGFQATPDSWPAVNINGLPMMPGTGIDVQGHTYGTGSEF